ncbi:hypothetical protein [Puniceicoccus vermicola]|uniref:Uncharacterized protein n=1 Tax=Puniceicoccus vermicola TaxID=388746 RepID=A0A7X1AVJ9_9BACT|nr:hypothetical protein [Puniceicoccus vermicola]MBC2600806.1 hypothetical protein [Puniceicoccus vermicola]
MHTLYVGRKKLKKPIPEIVERLNSLDGTVVGLSLLEHTYEEAKDLDTDLPKKKKLRNILLTALAEHSSGYWKGLACDWIKEGFPLDSEICETFENYTRRDRNVIQKKRQEATVKVTSVQLRGVSIFPSDSFEESYTG